MKQLRWWLYPGIHETERMQPRFYPLYECSGAIPKSQPILIG
jgi:hypothetical protein